MYYGNLLLGCSPVSFPDIASVIDGAHWHPHVASSPPLPSLKSCTLGLRYTDTSIHQLTYLRPFKVRWRLYLVGPSHCRCLLCTFSNALSEQGGVCQRIMELGVDLAQNVPDLINELCPRGISRSEAFLRGPLSDPGRAHLTPHKRVWRLLSLDASGRHAVQ